jgi:hypothetical protein
MILVIGNLQSWQRDGRSVPALEGFRFAGFDELTADLLDGVLPDLVLSPLMGESFDALDVAQRLDALGYRGRYRALTNPLPEPDAIRSEVRAVAPGLDFELFVMNEVSR